ncbi:MAG: inorganic diphosphatase [Acidobacteria bacterium]|nr:inorganic diphosphatase [Acidobacteriota bacterium]
MVTKLSDVRSVDPKNGAVNAIIETPRGSRAKFDYDEKQALFRLGGILPEGSSFPYNFGFIPSTRAEDGDPLDVLVLMEEPAFTGCLVPVRLIGVIEAEQRDEDGTTTRNDRIIAVASHSREQADIETLKALAPHAIEEIEHFFVSYNQVRGKEFKPLGRHGAKRAQKLLERAQRHRRRQHSRGAGGAGPAGRRGKAGRKAKSG